MSSEALEQEDKGSNEAEVAGAKLKALLAAVPAGEEVVLSAELAELLRWRAVTWNKLPKPVIPLMLPFLTVQETLGLDTALSERGEENEEDDAGPFEEVGVLRLPLKPGTASGYVGVQRSASKKRSWQATLTVAGRERLNVGSFKEPFDAAVARAHTARTISLIIKNLLIVKSL